MYNLATLWMSGTLLCVNFMHFTMGNVPAGSTGLFMTIYLLQVGIIPNLPRPEKTAAVHSRSELIWLSQAFTFLTLRGGEGHPHKAPPHKTRGTGHFEFGLLHSEHPPPPHKPLLLPSPPGPPDFHCGFIFV